MADKVIVQWAVRFTGASRIEKLDLEDCQSRQDMLSMIQELVNGDNIASSIIDAEIVNLDEVGKFIDDMLAERGESSAT